MKKTSFRYDGLTSGDITDYQKGCLHRSWGVSYEGYPLCCACNAEMKNGEVYAHEECAMLLLEGEVTERVKGENGGSQERG